MKLLVFFLACTVATGQATEKLRKLGETSASQYPVTAVDWISTSGRLVAIDSNSDVFLINPLGGILSQVKLTENSNQIENPYYSVAVHHKAGCAAVTISSPVFSVKYNWDKLKIENRFDSIGGCRAFFYVTSKNKLFAAGPNWLRVLNDDMEVVREFLDIPVDKFVVTSDEKGVFCAGGTQVIVYSGVSGKELKRFPAHDAQILALAISKDSKYVATASADKTVKVWNAETYDCVATLKGHGGWVNALDFIPGEDLIVTGGEDRTLRLWNFSSGECLQAVTPFNGSVRFIKTSPDEKMFAASGGDGKVIVYSVKKK